MKDPTPQDDHTTPRKRYAMDPEALIVSDDPQADFFVTASSMPSKNPSPLPQLDTQGFPVEIKPYRTFAQRMRFRACDGQRKLHLIALHAIDPGSTAYTAAAMCGTQAHFKRSRSTKEIELQVNGCGQRTCPVCQIRHASELHYRLVKMLGHVNPNQWSFVTLTLRAMDGPLKDQLQFLRESFRRLRQQTIWDDNVHGGRAMIEVTYNRNTGLWHPHLHILCMSNYIDKYKLSKAWSKASLGSTIIDIQRINTGSEAAKYVSSYIGKTPDLSRESNSIALAVDYLTAIRGGKLVIPFGRLPKGQDPDDPSNGPPDPSDWVLIGSLEDVMAMARMGDDEALRMLRQFYGQDFDPNDRRHHDP